MVKIRRAYEVLFLGLFLFFLLITDLRYLKGWPVSLFLEATPLVDFFVIGDLLKRIINEALQRLVRLKPVRVLICLHSLDCASQAI